MHARIRGGEGTTVPGTLAAVSETDLLEPIRDVSHAVIHRLAPYVVEAGLAPSTFWPLHFLEIGESRHPGELARRLGVTAPASTSCVDQLVRLGYVQRRTSEEDRRQVVLDVTPKGRRALARIWERFDTSLGEALEGLPPSEIATTARTLRAIAARLREEGGTPALGRRR